MIVSLAHTLGLKVIAEGVEEDQQLELLRELGCDQIQGFLTGRPLPAEKIEPLLSRSG
jgi:EAL domain-containing protein (putative c-di-GMP-specific phosphodiesterase class I)